MSPRALALALLLLSAVCLASSEQRGDRTDCSGTGCADQDRQGPSLHEPGAGPADRERAASLHHHPPEHASGRQPDSSSPLLKVNFWLTLLISALVAALLS
ncbi:uncharacterized protein LOC144158942 [Haemaphysalis longicornis]